MDCPRKQEQGNCCKSAEKDPSERVGSWLYEDGMIHDRTPPLTAETAIIFALSDDDI